MPEMRMGQYLRPQLALRQTLSLRQTIRLRLSQTLRQCLLPVQLLDLLPGTARTDIAEANYLRKLAAIKSDKSLLAKIKTDHAVNHDVATQLFRLSKLLDIADLRLSINKATAGPDQGYTPSEFLAIYLRLLEETTTEQRPRLFQSIKELSIGKLFPMVEVLSELSPRVASSEVLFAAIATAQASDENVIGQLRRRLEFILPDRQLGTDDVKILFQLIQDATSLVTQLDFWHRDQENAVRDFLALPDCLQILGQYPALPPLLVATFFASLEHRQHTRFWQLVSEEYVTRNTDNRRALLAGMVAIRDSRDFSRDLEHILNHLVQVCTTSRELVEVFRQVRYFVQNRIDAYPFHITNAQELISYFQERGFDQTLAHLEIDRGYWSKIVEAVGRLDKRGVFSILLRLHAVYKEKGYARGMKLVSEVVVRLIDKTYQDFRYSHAPAKDQLACLKNPTPWQSNLIAIRHIGELSGIEPAIAAIKQLAPVMQRKFRITFANYGYWDAGSLQALYSNAEQRVKIATDSLEKTAAIQKKRQLEDAYRICETLGLLERLTLDGFCDLAQVFKANKHIFDRYPLLRDYFAEVESIFLQTATTRGKIERIVIDETDDLFDLLNIGVKPVQTCQRWTESTGYNEALLAYVLDGNKKLFQIKTTAKDDILSRVVVRLLPLQLPNDRQKRTVPMLLVERSYSTRWSNDIGLSLLQVLVDKAQRIADDNGGICALGFSSRDGKNQLLELLEQSAEKLQRKPQHSNVQLRLPDSINDYEYSDGLAGAKLIPSGSELKVGLTTFLIKGKDFS